MANTISNPFDAEKLNALLDKIVDELQDGVQTAIGAFHDLLDSATPDDFSVVNDAVIALFDSAVEAGDDVADLLNEVLGAWAQTFAGHLDAFVDLARRLYQQFSDTAAFFRAAIETLVGTVQDFPEFFRDLARTLLADTGTFRTQVETLLLPVFTAGGAVFGADAAAQALWLVLGDSGGPLGSSVTAFSLGVPAQGLSPFAATALGSAAFTLPVGTWLAAALIDALRQAGDFAEMLAGAPAANGFLDISLGPVGDYFAQIATDYLANVEDFAEALIAHLIEGAENAEELEWLLLQLARFTPVGIFILVVATTIKLVTNPVPWFDLLFNPIESDPNLAVLRLPRPSETTKYVIFSDVHRDERASARPPYQFGSIDHFLPSQQAYLELLKHHADAGYTIIEAGDCEELWFHRDFSVMPTEKMQQIVDTNAEIYAFLSELHAEGRYFRVIGNHDSYLRSPETFAVLRNAMERNGGPDFRLFDFLIIEGVKSMHDVPVYLGLDSNPNTERKPLIITHGHQWDFWNCASNDILGKIIVSAVVTPLDMLDDPFRDIAGISCFGTPLVNFKQVLSQLPVFDSWQSYEPAVVKLDRIQHMEDTERFFTDDIQYSETLAAIAGLLIPVAPGPGDSCGLPYGNACLMNLMCIGHTHNPHNMPYFDLGELPFLKSHIDALETGITAASDGLLNPQLALVRSNYINTGVCGWYDQCFWALDLGDQSHGTGQPKLINWTYNTRLDRPNHMDWELPHIPRDGGQTPGDIVDQRVRDLIAAGLDMVSDAASDAGRALASAPMTTVGRAAEAWKPSNVSIRFDGARAGIDALFLQIALGLLPASAGEFRVDLHLPKPIQAELARLMKLRLPGSGRSARRRLCAAIATMAVAQGVGRGGLRGGGGVDTSPVGLMMLLAQLVEAKDDRIAAKMSVSGTKVTCTLAFRKETRTQDKAGPDIDIRRPGRRDKAGSRGLTVRAYLRGAKTPLSGWTVQVRQTSGRGTKVVASARTDDQGRAALIGASVRDGRVWLGSREIGDIVLGLCPPGAKRGSKPILEQRLQRLPDAGEISLPVSYADLLGGKVFGSKIRPVAQRRAAICDSWRKRLADKRDTHAKQDLCLQDLVLATMGAISQPKTSFEKKAAAAVKKHLKDQSALGTVAGFAKKARASLKDCLGPDYVECDGSGSIRDVAKRIIRTDPRFDSAAKFFGTPSPDPFSLFSNPQPGRAFPSAGFTLNKSCIDRMNEGELPPDLTQQMQDLLASGAVLAQPRVNVLTVYDLALGGGQIARQANMNAKTVTFFVPDVGEETVSLGERVLDMDVELDDPACLVMQADETNRQAVVVDVQPGQTVTLYGSGFVSAQTRITASVRPWAQPTADGRMVADDTPLPAPGFSPLEVPVFGNFPLPDEGNTPTTYQNDVVTFHWPDAAAAPGLYRLRMTFANDSQYPTTISQGDDCAITVGKEDVAAQDLWFAVLPAPQPPGVKVAIDNVECIDITDPEHVLGVPWPDDLYLVGAMERLRINVPTDGSAPFEELVDTFTDDAANLLFFPGGWDTDMKMFPSGQNFDQLGLLESTSVHFELFEVEGPYDKVVIGTILTVAIIVIALIAAALAVAIFLILVALLVEPTQIGKIVAGALAAALATVLTFIFGTAFGAMATAIETIISEIDGMQAIGTGRLNVDGHKLLFELAPLRFHRALSANTDLSAGVPTVASLGDTITVSELGGEYDVTITVTGDQ